ncbi:MAG: DMT family transporter [Acidimicrobiia bacterium]
MSTLILAICAALLFGVATAAQHRLASEVPSHIGAFGLARRLATSPRWLAAKVGDIGAFALQSLALVRGSLIVVQAIVTSGLLVAVALDALAARRMPGRRACIGAGAVVVGVIAVVMVSHNEAGVATRHDADWIVLSLSTLAITTVAVIGTRGRHVHGTTLALCAGIAIAFSAALVKQAGGAFHDHKPAIGIAWAVGFLMVAVAGNIAAQRSFHLSPLTSTVPAMTGIEPVAAVVYGVALFDERLSGNAFWLALAMAVLSFGLIVTAAAERPQARLGDHPMSAHGERP